MIFMASKKYDKKSGQNDHVAKAVFSHIISNQEYDFWDWIPKASQVLGFQESCEVLARELHCDIKQVGFSEGGDFYSLTDLVLKTPQKYVCVELAVLKSHQIFTDYQKQHNMLADQNKSHMVDFFVRRIKDTVADIIITFNYNLHAYYWAEMASLKEAYANGQITKKYYKNSNLVENSIQVENRGELIHFGNVVASCWPESIGWQRIYEGEYDNLFFIKNNGVYFAEETDKGLCPLLQHNFFLFNGSKTSQHWYNIKTHEAQLPKGYSIYRGENK